MDLAALIVACLAFLTGALALGWQVASWVMDGRRVKLKLVHGQLGRGGAAVGVVRRDKRPKDTSKVRAEGFTGREVLGVQVTNIGRLPVKVMKYSVESTPNGWSFTLVGDSLGVPLPHWLQPGESETWYADVSGAARLLQAPGKRPGREVYMTVELGTGEKKRTPRSLVF